MSTTYTGMNASALKGEIAVVVGQLNGSNRLLGRFLHAVLEHAVEHSDGNIVACLYRQLKMDDMNSGQLRAVRHAALDCTGFVINCTNDKKNGIQVTAKRDQEVWSRIKESISAANLARLLGPELDGSGISTFVQRAKKKAKAANDSDNAEKASEVKNSYESAIGGLSTIMSEINEIAPNDAELLADLQVLLAMEAKLKVKLIELKARLGGTLAAAANG